MLPLSEEEVLRDLQVLDGLVHVSGRELVLPPTFAARFASMPFTVAAVDDDRAFIRHVLNDESVVPVVIETQVASGNAASRRWPRTFVGLKASGRPFAVVTRGLDLPLAIRLEGDPDVWGEVAEIRGGTAIAAGERPTRPPAVSPSEVIALHDADDDAYQALKLEWARAAEERRAEYTKQQALAAPVVAEAPASGEPTTVPQPEDTAAEKLHWSGEDEEWTDEIFTIIVEDEWFAAREQTRRCLDLHRRGRRRRERVLAPR